jgi:hypothetical protein
LPAKRRLTQQFLANLLLLQSFHHLRGPAVQEEEEEEMHLLGLPSCLLQLVFARDALAWPDSSIAPRAVPERMNALLQTGLASLRHLYPQISQGRFNAWELVQVMAWCSLLPGFWYLQRTRRDGISLPWSSTGRQRGLPGAKSIDKEGKSSTLLYWALLTYNPF